MIGTPKTLKVLVSRKLGDNEYGSYGVEAELEVSLPPDANRDEAFDENDSWLTAKVGQSMAEKKASIQKMQAESKKAVAVSEEAETKPEKKADAKELVPGEEHSEKVVKFTLAKRTDGKFELGLYGDYGGKPSQYPILRHVREREAMWGMLKPVLEDFDFGSLPVEFACEWLIHYAIGREFEIKQGEHKGEKSHYKDLLSIVAM